MKELSSINDMLAEYAERVPAKGMHIGYLLKAKELVDLHAKALAMVEEENSEELENITKEVKNIVN